MNATTITFLYTISRYDNSTGTFKRMYELANGETIDHAVSIARSHVGKVWDSVTDWTFGNKRVKNSTITGVEVLETPYSDEETHPEDTEFSREQPEIVSVRKYKDTIRAKVAYQVPDGTMVSLIEYKNEGAHSVEKLKEAIQPGMSIRNGKHWEHITLITDLFK